MRRKRREPRRKAQWSVWLGADALHRFGLCVVLVISNRYIGIASKKMRVSVGVSLVWI